MPSTQLFAWTPFEEELCKIKSLNPAIDEMTTSLESAVRDSDLVILCTPMSAMEGIAKQMLPYLKENCIITDVASVKGPIVENLSAIFSTPNKNYHYLSSHPMGGNEFEGFESSHADLFQGRTCILISNEDTSTANPTQKSLQNFWQQLGIRSIQILSSEEHDKIVAGISHLPYILSTALMLVGAEDPQALACAGPGFESATRLAQQPPRLWAEMITANRRYIIEEVNAVQIQIEQMLEHLENNRIEQLAQFLNVAVKQRKAFQAQKQMAE